MATPALGPSLPIAPSGMCRWMSRSDEPPRTMSVSVAAIPSANALARRYEMAIVTDSLMTSPSLPVVWIEPLPGMTCGGGRVGRVSQQQPHGARGGGGNRP